jgi:BMFP domain-containing protein YqiC
MIATTSFMGIFLGWTGAGSLDGAGSTFCLPGRMLSPDHLRVGQSLQTLTENADGAADFHSPTIYFDECEALSMMDRQDIDEIALRLVSLVPPGLAQAQQDLRANFQDVLAHGLRRLDLVTREEFEVQSQLLARTRAKVDELERRVAALEAAIAARGS